jgi:hypothetical protein
MAPKRKQTFQPSGLASRIRYDPNAVMHLFLLVLLGHKMLWSLDIAAQSVSM